ncbi:hypothetical protein CSHOW_1537 [Campylobacter showae]|uniref:Uncharacterized protein n=1 Tax=Campylobacter showae RM3277 TaxID=553219 RepID=C6RIN0_9BACT|nr:hypothetical protein [Campylobacter showae]EET78773.1 hypothetical protein CAMSH0001_1377 [Campylobacter showae RM3277]QCD49445.1 hypothetical protein CSHOW_1537 [Campylobacter showae]
MKFYLNEISRKRIKPEQRYKFHRAARYLLALPIVFLLVWWAAALILAVLPFEGALRIAVFAAIFAILACALLWYLFKKYKNFKPSRLFIKNPNLSLLLFTVKIYRSVLFTAGFWYASRRGIFWASVRQS